MKKILQQKKDYYNQSLIFTKEQLEVLEKTIDLIKLQEKKEVTEETEAKERAKIKSEIINVTNKKKTSY